MEANYVGYTDPNDLKFEDITILGVRLPPMDVTVTHLGSGNVTHVPNTKIQHSKNNNVSTYTLDCICVFVQLFSKIALKFSYSEYL